ncbi:MAG: ABC transporter permease [Planctomycetota bacterium]
MRAWLLARKDLGVYLRDRIGMLLGFGLPIVLATVFGAAMGTFGGGSDSVGRVALAVEDRDGTKASADLLASLGEADGLRVWRIEIAGEDATTARAKVAEGDFPAGLLIPEGYGTAVAAGEVPPLTLYRDPGKEIEQQIVAGNLLPALFDAAGEALGHRMMLESLEWFEFPAALRDEAHAILEGTWDGMQTLVRDWEEDGAPAPAGTASGEGVDAGGEDAESRLDFGAVLTDALGLEVEDVVGGGDAARARRIASQAHAVAGIAVMMLLFGLVACGGTLLEERDGGTLDRLRLVPGAARAILGGKFLFTWVVGMAQLAVLFLYGRLIFDLPIFRAPVALAVLSTAVAAAATGFGVLFAVVSRSRKQLEGLSTLVILLMSALGGSWFPLVITPDWYRFLGHFTLTAWAMDAYQALFWYEQELADILPEIGILLAIAAATCAAAHLLWTRRQRA